MQVLAVMAHPDDAELWCGGTLLRHVQAGDAVCLAVLAGRAATPRWAEAEEGARLLGCRAEPLGLSDTAVRDSDSAVDRLRELLLTFWPDIVLTHWFDDMHPDHEASFQILRRALLKTCLDAAVDDLGTFPRTFCCDTYHSRGLHGEFIPDRYVDVTEVWEAKLTALKAHKSQQLSHYLAMISSQGAHHGRAAGTAWAEGFVYVPLYGRQDEGPPLGRSYTRYRLPQAPGTDTGASLDNLAQ